MTTDLAPEKRLVHILALADRAAGEGSRTVSLQALYDTLGELPITYHLLTITANGSPHLRHTRGCHHADCETALAMRRAPLLSSPHARGRAYEVWLEGDGHWPKFREVWP